MADENRNDQTVDFRKLNKWERRRLRQHVIRSYEVGRRKAGLHKEQIQPRVLVDRAAAAGALGFKVKADDNARADIPVTDRS